MCYHWENAPSWSEWVLTTSSVNCWWTEWRPWTAPTMSCSSAQVECVCGGLSLYVYKSVGLCFNPEVFTIKAFKYVDRLWSGSEGHPSAQRTRSESRGHSGAAAGLSGTENTYCAKTQCCVIDFTTNYCTRYYL